LWFWDFGGSVLLPIVTFFTLIPRLDHHISPRLWPSSHHLPHVTLQTDTRASGQISRIKEEEEEGASLVIVPVFLWLLGLCCPYFWRMKTGIFFFF